MFDTIRLRGCALTYKLQGSEDPIVFIQGVGLHGDVWLPQTRRLSPYFQCLTFDWRGVTEGTDITVEQMAEDTVAVMDAAGLRTAHIVGHSLGGAVAMQLALTARHRVRSLSLLCTSSRGSDATRLTLPMFWLRLRNRTRARQMYGGSFRQIILPHEPLAGQGRDIVAERFESLFGYPFIDSACVVIRQLDALKRFDITARLPELAGIPTMILSATGDRIFPPKYGRQLAASIPEAQYVEIPDSAHGFSIQSVEAVNRELLEHFIAVT